MVGIKWYYYNELLCHQHHSDYGYLKTPHGNGCTKDTEYDLSKHCTVGQKTYLKSSSGLRLIPDDLCTNTKSFVTYSNATCTGYDYDAGVDYSDGNGGGGVDDQRSKVQ